MICENNRVAISVPFEKQSPVLSIADRACAYNIPGVNVDGSDSLAVYRATREAVERARRGEGPSLIETRVTRLGQHTSQVGDSRSPVELANARKHDPLPRLAGYLREHHLLDDADLANMTARAIAEVDDAVRFAQASAAPPSEQAFADTYGSR